MQPQRLDGNPIQFPEWYAAEQQAVEKQFAHAKRLDDKTETRTSPSGKYSLELVFYEIGPYRLQYSQGVVRQVATGAIIADVKRSLVDFPFSWVERHPAGHDYLIVGEDFQGQTVIELDSGNRADYVPEGDRDQIGFCSTAYYPSPDGKFIFVDACPPPGPYELVLFDFSRPMELPYREIKRWPVCEVQGFQPDGSFVFNYEVLVRTSDGKCLDEMAAAELEEFEAMENYGALYGEKKIGVRWYPNSSDDVFDVGVRMIE